MAVPQNTVFSSVMSSSISNSFYLSFFLCSQCFMSVHSKVPLEINLKTLLIADLRFLSQEIVSVVLSLDRQ